MYEKNLTEDFRLRLSKNDMEFLKNLSCDRSVSVSEVVRSIIGEYRRSLETLSVLKNFTSSLGGQMSHGDTETYINDKL